MMRRRAGPSDPAEAAARRRAAERDDPGQWGPSQQVTGSLATAGDVEISVGGDRVRARRRDVLRTLFLRDAITADQHSASERYFEDRVEALGVRSRAWPPVLAGAARGNVAELVTQRMIDAGRRVDAAERAMGVRSHAVLRAIVDPLVDGRDFDWRAAVERASGERDPAAQAAVMRFTLQDLSEIYRAMNRVAALRRGVAGPLD